MRRVAALLLAGTSALVACVTNEPIDARVYPDREEFIQGGVSAMMESRCAGMDCHGQVGRPLRLYSANGLRLAVPEQGLRDTRPTTREEQEENYASVIGLEPDAIADCLASGGRYVDFQLLLKPLDDSGRGIRHKGGPVLRAANNDPGWNCLFGWAAGTPDRAACKAATF